MHGNKIDVDGQNRADDIGGQPRYNRKQLAEIICFELDLTFNFHNTTFRFTVYMNFLVSKSVEIGK